MDYIFDWARDIYREAVIRSLRRLAVTDSRSLAYQDSDIFSTAERIKIWAVVDEQSYEQSEELLTEAEQEPDISDALRSFDTRHGVIRDIRYIHSRFFGLRVTGDNLDAFLRSENTPQQCRQLACSLLAHLQESWRVKGEMLDALESDWTGKTRREEQPHQEATFLVVAAVAAYLTPDWEQTRELSYLAVEEGAVDRLLKYSGRRLAEGHTLSDLPFVDEAGFRDSLLACRRQSAMSNLIACISRVCLSTGILSSRNEDRRDALSVISVEKSAQGITVRADTVLKPDATKRDFVRAIYDRHKIGRNEPFCPFLRASSVRDELGLPEESLAPTPAKAEVSRWFKVAPDIPGMAGEKVLTVMASNPVAGCTTPRLCLFVTDPAAICLSGLRIQELLQSEASWYFRARRYDNKRGWSNGWNTEPEAVVAQNRPIIRQLAAFAESLKTLPLGAHPSQKQKGTGAGSEFEHAWAPKKPDTMWDVLLAPGLEFMSDAAPAMPRMPANNPRQIRPVNREDTPRPTPEPNLSKGKERDTVQQAEPHGGCSMWAESISRPGVPMSSTRQIATEKIPPWRLIPVIQKSHPLPVEPERLPTAEDAVQPQGVLQGTTANVSSPPHPPRSTTRPKSPEHDGLERSPKRQCSSHDWSAASSNPAAPHTGSNRRPLSLSHHLSIPPGVENMELYLDDEVFAKMLADGFFS